MFILLKNAHLVKLHDIIVRMKERPSQRIETQTSINERYIQAIRDVETLGNKLEIDHRFVGGTFTDLINPQTRVVVDHHHRVIHLENYNPLTMLRTDGTVKDIDLICFCPDQERFHQLKQLFEKQMVNAKKRREYYPFVSVEPTHHPNWPKRKRWKQFVTTFDVDEKGVLSLNFGRVHQPISWESVEPWRVDFNNGVSFTILNPYAHALCYLLRIPSGVKNKDRKISVDSEVRKPYSKISILMRLAAQINMDGKINGYDYRGSLYQSWIEYIRMLLKHPDPLTAFKAKITRAYWNGPGEAIAHGRGILNPLSKLSNRMSG